MSTYDWDAHLAALKADNARLREVAARLNKYRLGESFECPWCGVDDGHPSKPPHAADCLAFTPDGEVK